ncbi:MAG: TlpA family protein disulfide reductase, partial [Dehalococcoidia bacterium]|nr:TlpA family protein disulfide reductase [Dehalococcoidia bacterium]
GPGVIERSVRAKVGERGPDFALEDAATGRLVRLSEYRGRTVVLNFWATWCVPCRSEMPDLQRASEAGAGRGDLVVIGVDDREPERVVTAFAREVGVTFPLLLDRASVVRAHYGVVGLPGTFFIDREGVIRGLQFGPFGERLAEGIAAAEAPSRR